MAKIIKKLTSKQKRFCEEYVVDVNQTQAAIRAGYSKRTASSQASRLLTKVNIVEYVDKLKAEILENSKISIDECIQRLTAMARFDVLDFYDENGAMKDLKDVPEDARMAVEALDVDEIRIGDISVGESKKLKLSSRRATIVELMKYLGGFEKDNAQKRDNVVMGKVQMIIQEHKSDD